MLAQCLSIRVGLTETRRLSRPGAQSRLSGQNHCNTHVVASRRPLCTVMTNEKDHHETPGALKDVILCDT